MTQPDDAAPPRDTSALRRSLAAAAAGSGGGGDGGAGAADGGGGGASAVLQVPPFRIRLARVAGRGTRVGVRRRAASRDHALRAAAGAAHLGSLAVWQLAATAARRAMARPGADVAWRAPWVRRQVVEAHGEEFDEEALVAALDALAATAGEGSDRRRAALGVRAA